MLIKLICIYKQSKISEGWFLRARSTTKEMPMLAMLGQISKLYKNSVICCAVHEWNKLFGNRKHMIIDDDDFNFIDMVKAYLLEFRASIFVYFWKKIV